jgi:hypothetical protein
LDEALALSFGKVPEVVSWEVVQPHFQVSQFARFYARRRELAVRALQWEQLYDPVLPGIFIIWAKRTQIEFPPELEAAVAANGHVIEDWKSLYDKLCASIDERIAPWKEAADTLDEIVVHRDAHPGLPHQRVVFRSNGLPAGVAPRFESVPTKQASPPLGDPYWPRTILLTITLSIVIKDAQAAAKFKHAFEARFTSGETLSLQ